MRWLTWLLARSAPASRRIADSGVDAAFATTTRISTLRWPWLLFSRGVAIDLGTTHTRVSRTGQDGITHQATVVALRTDARGHESVLVVGDAARRMIGRTPPSIRAVRPLQGGALADFQATELLLRHLIQGEGSRLWRVRPRVVIAVPTGITAVERRALREAVHAGGARHVHLIPTPLAAALGSGLPVQEPQASMIVDVGGGTTDVAVMALGGLVRAASIRVGGDTLDHAIRSGVRRKFDLSIGEEAAEQIKIAIGRVSRDNTPCSMSVQGSDLMRREPKLIELGSDDVSDALAEPMAAILQAIHNVLEGIPPELAADLVDTGITLTGEGSLLTGFDTLVHESTHLPVTRSRDPSTAVVLGCRLCLDTPDLLAQLEIP